MKTEGSRSAGRHRPYGLQRGINRCLDDGLRRFLKCTLAEYGAYDWPRILSDLERWRHRGLLRYLMDIERATDQDEVVEMLNYIDQPSPWPNWPKRQSDERIA